MHHAHRLVKKSPTKYSVIQKESFMLGLNPTQAWRHLSPEVNENVYMSNNSMFFVCGKYGGTKQYCSNDRRP